jgi:hypothetical protein
MRGHWGITSMAIAILSTTSRNIIFCHNLRALLEKLDGRAVSALGVRSRKLSTGLNGQS